MNARKDATVVEVLLYTPEQAAQALAISRAKTYELIGSGSLRSIHIGSARRVPVQECAAWVQRELAAQAADGTAP